MKNIPFEEVIEKEHKIHKKGYKTPDGKVINGTYTTFYKNGQVMEKVDYKDGVFKKKDRYYWPSKYLTSLTFKDGLMHGEYKRWNDNGDLMVSGTYTDGHMHGEWKSWYNDRLSTLSNYKDGELNGQQKVWHTHTDGRLRNLEHYKNGKWHGEVKEWCDNGQISIHSNYKDGKEHGERKEWHKNGRLSYYANFKNGEYHGTIRAWHDDGSLWLARYFLYGRMLYEWLSKDDYSICIFGYKFVLKK